jgi:hypothetical protein
MEPQALTPLDGMALLNPQNLIGGKISQGYLDSLYQPLVSK